MGDTEIRAKFDSENRDNMNIKTGDKEVILEDLLEDSLIDCVGNKIEIKKRSRAVPTFLYNLICDKMKGYNTNHLLMGNEIYFQHKGEIFTRNGYKVIKS